VSERLTKAQRTALAKLTNCGRSSYELHTRLSTLRSLVRRGLAVSWSGTGSIFFPQDRIIFWITPAGRDALAKDIKP